MKKALLFAAALAVAGSAYADYYIIGDNVNGKSWTQAAPDAKFTDKGNGIFEWTGEVLGTGFKINDGTWDNADKNIGDGGTEVEKGVPTPVWAGSTSGNIKLYNCAAVNNPTVVFDSNKMEITVTGDFGGSIKWYLCGIDGVYVASDSEGAIELIATDNDGEFKAENFAVNVAEGGFKVSSTGWAEQYGTTSEDVYVDDSLLGQEIELELVGGEAGNVPYELTPGNYDAVFNLYDMTIVFSKAGETGIAAIDAEEGEAVYYNMQGVRVAEPKNGVFVKVIGKKAAKVAVND
ncbi:MAG: hypothetical protein NC328_01850 [Muribaculum sp.]|nr:hypothetical protein [Muribaculum sp.]